MAGSFVTMRVTALFFDAPKVKRAVDLATRKALSKAGAFIRQRAKTSMRRRRGAAPPGSPPHAHNGLLRKFLFFGFDPGSQSVVIGPARLNKRGRAPSVLEFGGAATIEKRRKRKDGRIVLEKRRVNVAARPYMGPALAKELPNFPGRWANSVRGG